MSINVLHKNLLNNNNNNDIYVNNKSSFSSLLQSVSQIDNQPNVSKKCK
jgi:hypothetical protein